MDDPLIWWRAIHFAATMMVAGVVFFLALVGEPAFAFAGKRADLPALLRSRLGAMAWVGLLLVVVSGAAWLVLLAQQISDGTLTAVLWDGIVWIVLTKTGFGTDWAVRLCFVVLLTISLPIGPARAGGVRRSVTIGAAAALAGALGFAGHAAVPPASRASSISRPISCISSRPPRGLVPWCRSPCCCTLPGAIRTRPRWRLPARPRSAFRRWGSQASAHCWRAAWSTPGCWPAASRRCSIPATASS